jgi:hypothetical protein
MNPHTKFTCYVCGYRTLESRCDWDVCPVCFWEDDVLVCGDEDVSSSANNGMLISAAQTNFLQFGAVSREFLGKVRPPRKDETRDPEWRPLTRVSEFLSTTRDNENKK